MFRRETQPGIVPATGKGTAFHSRPKQAINIQDVQKHGQDEVVKVVYFKEDGLPLRSIGGKTIHKMREKSKRPHKPSQKIAQGMLGVLAQKIKRTGLN